MKMLDNKVKALLFIFLILFCISAVNAESINDTDTLSVDIVNVESDSYVATIDDDSSSSKSGSFSDLNSTINSNPENNSIILDKNYTYNKTSDGNFKNGIIINRTLTIDGQGFTINGNYEAVIFKVINGSLTIKNIIIINGNNTAEYGDGGAIYSEGNLTVINSTFINNTAKSDGGAIYSEGNLTVINSTFINNTAYNGGAIYSEGNLTVINSTFINNTANMGGSIYVDHNHLSIINSTFENNTASLLGGAILTLNSFTIVTNSNFNQNSAIYEGGAIGCGVGGISTNLIVINSNFTKNVAELAGAIASNSNAAIIDSTFINNTAECCGGAVFVRDNLNITNSIFENNSAIISGAIASYNNVNITESKFINNNAANGGSIYVAGNVTMNNSIFINNNATNGGSIYYTTYYNFWMNIYEIMYSKMSKEEFDKVIKQLENESSKINTIDTSMTIMNSNFKENNGQLGDDIYTEHNTTLLNNTYTENSYANIYANNTYIDGTVISVLQNTTYYVIYGNEFKVNATVLADGASIQGYNITITDGTNNYTTTYKGHGIYEITINITADFISKQYSAILETNEIYNKYIIENGTVTTKKKLVIEVDLDNTVFGENITGNITLTDENGDVVDVSGDVTIEIDGRNYTGTITNGTGSFVIDDQLPAGNYTLKATFNETEDYGPAETSVDFEIEKADPDLDVEIRDIDGNLTMDIIMNPDINGNVTVTIDNETFVVEIRNGSGSLDLSGLESGVHNFTVDFEGNSNYNPAETAGEFDTNGIILEVDYLTKYYGSDKKLNIRLRDALGNPLANQNITIKINGVTYTRTTDENGTVLMSINLIPGVYETEVSYENLTETVNVTVISTIESEDLIKYFKNGSQYYAKFLNVDGTPLANTNVTFNIHGVFYTRTTDADGIAKLNINLNPGEYIITAWNPVNTESKSNVITVLSTIFGENVVKFYRNGTQYYARVLDANGNPLANANVTFNIHGVFYNRTSNEEGIVKLNINLNPGEYIITAWNLWNGEAKSNNITVHNVVLTENLEMTTSARKPFKVTILGEQGKPLANAKVVFNIHGIFYEKTTDANGQVSLDINLIAGKYIITTYYNEYSVSNTIVVK